MKETNDMKWVKEMKYIGLQQGFICYFFKFICS